MSVFSRKKDTVVFLVHGFGLNTVHEFDSLVKFLNQHHYRTVQFPLYDPFNEKDVQFEQWIERAETMLKATLSKHKKVTIIGFSMGGVIASYLASVYPIQSLILVAPAFYYENMQTATNAAKSIAKSVISKDKGTKSNKNKSISSNHTLAFMKIVDTYREAIAHVTCPILIIHGTDDEVIRPRSSKKSYDKIPHNKKRLIYLEGAHHKMLYDHRMEKTPFTIILQMLEGNIL